jgi:copper chaperone
MQTESMNVTGMTCGGCTGKVEKALKAIPGVKDVQVSLSAASATVQFDETLASTVQLASAVKAAGYGVAAGNGAVGRPTKAGCCDA